MLALGTGKKSCEALLFIRKLVRNFERIGPKVQYYQFTDYGTKYSPNKA